MAHCTVEINVPDDFTVQEYYINHAALLKLKIPVKFSNAYDTCVYLRKVEKKGCLPYQFIVTEWNDEIDAYGCPGIDANLSGDEYLDEIEPTLFYTNNDENIYNLLGVAESIALDTRGY